MNETEIKLTAFSRGAGCGCKIAPSVLREILQSSSNVPNYPSLLVGNGTSDDAAVYDLGNGQALISTTDFFMPIVDDAFDFGQIASANAISDVYAMGGKPLMAIAILGWPIEKLSPSLASKVMEGAQKICAEAGIPLAGGHSIDSPEPMFGLSVNGLIAVSNLKQNHTARENDFLFLTKPIGTGILSTAQKRGVLQPEHEAPLIHQMTSLNKMGELLGKLNDVTAMTDVTGFGILGHVLEMANGAQLSVDLFYDSIPLMDGVSHYLSQRIAPDATFRNWNSYNPETAFEKGVNVMEAFHVLPDPQTNGGLLFSVKPSALPDIQQLLDENGLSKHRNPIGQFISRKEKTVEVKLHSNASI